MEKKNRNLQIDKYFAIARERYSILLKRCAGLPKPWSDDPIFQREYFCNVFRTDDRTTMWLQENILDIVIDDPRKALFAIVAFRWFNRIETGEKIKPFLLGEKKWDSVKVHNLLAAHRPIVTGAYVIKTPTGMNKLKGVIWCIDEFQKSVKKESVYYDNLFSGGYSMQTACELLQHVPFLGKFLAWQICSDARQTCLLASAPDINTWAQPGPGSARGLGRVYYNDVDHFTYGSPRDEEEMLILMRDLSERSKDVQYWPKEWPRFDAVINHSHNLCEYDKYCRAEEGGRMKRKYNGNN